MTKDIEYYMALFHPVELIRDEDGWYFAQIPMLRGCMTNGENADDALEMLEDAKRGWIEVALERGRNIPEPI